MSYILAGTLDEGPNDKCFPNFKKGGAMRKLILVMGAMVICLVGLPVILFAQAAYTFWASEDAWVNKSNAEVNYGKNTYLSVKDRSGISEAYVKFNQADIDSLANQRIEKADFFLYQYQGTISLGDSLNLHRISSDWSEASVSWDNRPEYDLETLSSLNITSASGWRQWTGLEDEFSKWTQETCFGLALENHLDSRNNELYARFYSSEYSDPLLRPHLEVTATTITPEPASCVLFALGVALLTAHNRRRV